MTTKKEILDWIKSIAKNQDLIATKQNTERKAEAITTQTLLAEIFKELHSIRTILEDAAKEPEKRDGLSAYDIKLVFSVIEEIQSIEKFERITASNEWDFYKEVAKRYNELEDLK